MNFGGQIHQVHIARIAFVPHAADADLSFVHVGPVHAGGVKHGLRRALRRGLSNSTAVFIDLSHNNQTLAGGTRGNADYKLREIADDNSLRASWQSRDVQFPSMLALLRSV